ncbi:FecR domain-containing protein [Ketobacter alkanivorans]|uniref:FecR protein domain-containing protein n=1 Tax=Ketobacter alkanivorans TaxID=1917421 RepID=A0A2K9LHH5_9GAMM|nr:FecR domain-containing protein [Ketobacter alkanivorans]AUM11818.1 hypothetical protein Kalk_05010 [Ketobacter alkanivorans]
MRTPTAVVLWLSFLFQSVAYACDDWAAMVVSVNGHVQLKHADVLKVDGVVSENKNLKPDDVVCPGQQLHVGANSRAAIYLRNNSFVRLDENTILSFPAAYTAESQGFWIEVKQGVSHFISRLTQRFEVRTTYTNAAVDGTEFLVAADANGSKISVIEGQVSVTPVQSGATQTLIDGQSATLVKGSPMQVMQLTATDTVDWAVYFPPLVLTAQLSSPKYNQQLSRASRHITAGRADLAIQLLTSIPAPDTAVQVSLASAYLSVGNLRLAKMVVTDIHTGEALALQSLIATLTNQPQQAVELAQSAVKANSQSLAALLALTYAYQGNLQLNAALEVAREAAQAYPQEYIVWVRLSELQVATGDISGADQSIDRAMALNNAAPVVLVQSGFVDLFNHHYKQAESLFRSAIKADSENPQARLGMGLVLLRQGELEAGRMQLEYAVSLDPARSVLRSYLGRAYFEEKRDDEASVQWALAKQLDPQDPTAYYYEGVRKLYSNDPVGAIEELETSRRLNDERALYRSETLLQGDAASRSAALARAYDEVGYDQGVLLAGWDAIRQDPTNSEGHRLLADKYRGNSRYDAARASELLQSQLWQPLSAYPLQPQLSETGIGFVEGAGPQQPGYNEYHSLFTQDGVYGAVNGYGGSDGTWGDDLVGSFLAGPVAVSLGQYHFESDGWRDNADQEQDVYSGFVQWEVSPSTSLQFEHRHLEWTHGEIYGINSDDDIVDYARDFERDTSRIGGTHRLSSDSYLLVSAIRQTYKEHQSSVRSDGIETVSDLEVDPSAIEFQLIRRYRNGSLIFGAGYLQEERDLSIVSSVFGFDFYKAISISKYDQINIYLYVSQEVQDGFGLEGGVSYLRGEDVGDESAEVYGMPTDSNVIDSDDRILPKIGAYWELSDDWLIRSAVYQTFMRNESSMQTVEPTMFMGFDQVFSVYDQTEALIETISIDGRIDENLFAGLAIYRRDYEYNVTALSDADYLVSAEENGYSVYLNSSFSNGLSLTAEYYSSRLRDDLVEDAQGVASLNDVGIPLAVRYSFDDRWKLRLYANYFRQEKTENQSDGFSPIVAVSSTEENIITGLSAEYLFDCRCGKVVVGLDNLEDIKDEYEIWNSSSFLFYPGRFGYASINFVM